MKCPGCGKDIVETARFCTYCGLQLTNQQGDQSIIGGQSSNQSNSVPLDNIIAPASNNNSENTQIASEILNNNGLPPKKDNAIVSAWKKLSFFSKLFTIAITISGILFIISVAMHKGFPILFSCILIFGLIVALFMHKQLFFKQPHNFYKYLIAFGSFALIVVTIWSFTWNGSIKSYNAPAQTLEQADNKNASIKMPASSASYIGQMYEDVSSELAGLGFRKVRAEVVKDLAISERNKERTVISVTADSKSFDAGEEIASNSSIVIRYHILADIAVPISSDEARTMDYKKVAEIFKTAGFTNVVTTTVQDKDPDEMMGEFETTITIGTNAIVGKDLSVPADTKIEIYNHTAYEKYPVILHIENNCSVGMKIKIDSIDEDSVEPTAKKDIEYKTKKGNLSITITLDNTGVKPVEKQIEIDGPVNIAYVFNEEDSKYQYHKLYEEHNRELNAGEIRLSIGILECSGDYNNVADEFRRLGFKNVNVSPVYDQADSSHDNIIASVKIRDKSEFYKGEIYKENDPVKIVYHMASTSDPNYTPAHQEPKPGQQSSTNITVDNNPEFASLITGHNGSGKEFFKNHVGDIIEFDGNASDMNIYADRSIRYDYLIEPGDYTEDSPVSSVIMQLRDVSKAELKLDPAMKGLYTGDNIHIIAKIKRFDEMTELVQLESVAITPR